MDYSSSFLEIYIRSFLDEDMTDLITLRIEQVRNGSVSRPADMLGAVLPYELPTFIYI